MLRRNTFTCAVFVLLSITMQAQSTLRNSITPAQIALDSKEYPAYDSGSTAEEVVASGKNFDPVHNTFVIVNRGHEELSPGRAPSADPLIEFQSLTYNSDLVVLATPTLRVSALTDSHKFIFSDYQITIDAVLKDHTGSFSRGAVAVVTRPGGETNVGSSKVRAIETEFPLFHVGEQYLFFLHKSEGSGSYKVRPSEAYLVGLHEVIPGRVHPKVDLRGYEISSILSEIQVAMANDKRISK